MKKFLLLLFILPFFIFSCKKDSPVVFDFSKITYTDSACNVTGTIDSTDWTCDSSWTTLEKSFLKFVDTLSISDTVMGTISISPACNNPNNGLFIVGLNTERECKMKTAVVNSKMEVLWYGYQKFTGGPVWTTFDFRSLTSFANGNYYRLYYGFFNSRDSLYCKGHGDFRVE